MDDPVTALIVGFAAGLLVMLLVLVLYSRRLVNKHALAVDKLDSSITDLRQERAEDKETNRRLRHELVAKSPSKLVDAANSAELDRDSAVSERDQAVEQLQLVQQDLSQATAKLADRESKLREYREALKEIRISLEAQDQARMAAEAGGVTSADLRTAD